VKIDPTGAGERPIRAAQGGLSAGQPGEHATHDQLLVAGFVGGDVSDAEADAARELLSACADCRLLASDLLAISRATSELPAPIRTRDFRISPEEAARLRRSGLRSWLARLGGGQDGASDRLVPLQRLAAATVAIGLVMAVVTSPMGIPGFSSGGTTLRTVGQPLGGGEGAFSTAAAVPTGVPPAAAAAPAASAMAAAPAPSAAGPAAMAAAPVSAAPVSAAPASAAPVSAASARPLLGAAGQASSPGPRPSAAASAGQVSDTGPAATAGALTVPGPSAQPGVAFNRTAPLTGPVPAGGAPVEAWQAWLLLAVAGLLAFGAIRLLRRRAV
jgi:hypothetical protein